MNNLHKVFRAALSCAVFLLAPAHAADLSELKTGGPYVPTPQSVVDSMLRIAAVTETDYVIDLGSGDGIIVLTAARQYKAGGMGVDIDPDLVKLSNASAQKFGVASRVRFVQDDVFKADLSKATVLTLYLLPSMMMNLRAKIFTELKPGSRIVSHDYHFGEWAPDDSLSFEVPEKESVTGVPRATVLLWFAPARVAGSWEIKTSGGESYQVALKQRFQVLDAVVTSAGKPLKMQTSTLRGNEIAFALAEGKGLVRFSGRVAGETMEGTVEGAGRPAQRWSAIRTAVDRVTIE